MKLFLRIAVLLLFPTFIFAQPSSGFKGNRPDSLRRNAPRIGKVFGSLRDAETNQPVSFAAVVFLSPRDSAIVGGVQTNEKGNFLAEDLPLSKMILKASFIGYAPIYVPLQLSFQIQELDANIIKMKSVATKLKDVTITGEKSDYVNSIDRKVYNLDKNIVNTGGTVTEVLQNIPSVSVDIDGKVSLRGSENVTILIDGKPSGMLGNDRKAVLQQIPASAVEQIEVITNPSAKYDADGMSGIINIKTKKEKMRGLNGNLTAGVGTNEKFNVGIGGNDRSPRKNVYASYNFRHEKRSINGGSTQFNHFQGSDAYYYSNNSHGSNLSDNHSGKVGIDFFINKYNTLGVNASLSNKMESHPEQIQYSFYTPELVTFNSFFRNNTEDNKNFNYDLNTDYKHTWDSTSRELTANLSFSSNNRNSDNTFKSSLYSGFNLPYQKDVYDNVYQNILLQTDFMQPMKGKAKLEAGLKSTNRYLNNQLDYSDYNFTSLLYEKNNFKSDHFVYNEQIAAAYAMYTGKVKKFDYNVGLRAEQTFAKIESQTISQTYNVNYLSLFPSAFVKYPLSEKSDLQISYSRRVNRPDSRALNPFVDYSDSLNVRKGNPFLRPEYTNALELSYALTLSKWSLTSSIYYRKTNDMISRYRTVDPVTGIGTMSTINFSTAENSGGELVIRYTFEKAGSLMATFNIYQSKINGTNVQADYQTNSLQWFTRLNANLKLSKNTALQLTGNYTAPMKTVNGEIKGMSGVDVGLKQDIWKGKASLSLNVTDIFLMKKFQFVNYSDFYYTTGWRNRESRVAMLSFSYKFGKADSNIFNRKKPSRQGNQDNSSDMIDY